jgi:methionyl aminopeptidase
MTIDGVDDLEALKRAGKAVAEARDRMLEAVCAGISTLELDAIGREVLTRHGARSAPKLAYDFPGWTCISVNDEIAHGIPSTRRLADGDLVNIDVSAELDGYWADSGASRAVGQVGPRLEQLLQATKLAQAEGMAEARAGEKVSKIGRAVERRAKRHGFKVIKNLCGHGVGRHIHEAPSVPGVYDPKDRTTLWEGLVITIEPFLTTRATVAVESNDGWTLRTPDRSLAAQFEHTLVVTNGAPIIVT